ncbi:MAG TPA: hypothetical protein GXX29_13365 [Firmicutes bacterium]|nr:hypothetical protein [Bacillota bacterium]
MSWFDVLFGRTKLSRAKTDDMFALITARVDLESDLGWQPAGRAALCLKPVTTLDFRQAQEDVVALVRLTAADSRSQVKFHEDEFRYQWLLLYDDDFEDLVGVVHIAGKELQAKGYGQQLLAAVYTFTTGQAAEKSSLAYLIYSYKRGRFYPFIPLPGKKRDTAAELRAAALIEKYLPLDKDHTRWYPLWDCPV